MESDKELAEACESFLASYKKVVGACVPVVDWAEYLATRHSLLEAAKKAPEKTKPADMVAMSSAMPGIDPKITTVSDKPLREPKSLFRDAK